MSNKIQSLETLKPVFFLLLFSDQLAYPQLLQGVIRSKRTPGSNHHFMAVMRPSATTDLQLSLRLIGADDPCRSLKEEVEVTDA